MCVESQNNVRLPWFKSVTVGWLGPDVFELNLVFMSVTD